MTWVSPSSIKLTILGIFGLGQAYRILHIFGDAPVVAELGIDADCLAGIGSAVAVAHLSVVDAVCDEGEAGFAVGIGEGRGSVDVDVPVAGVDEVAEEFFFG